jgi:hypothetical protein
MKKAIITLSLMSVLACLPALAGEEKELDGKAMCAKCELKKADKCHTVIEVKDGSTTKLYWTTDNEVAKKFHKEVCTKPLEVTAKGKVEEKDGKLFVELAKIEKKEKASVIKEPSKE